MYAKLTTDLTLAARYLAAGRIVAFPTGTSYGLAADALQGHALIRLRQLKQRPAEKPFSIFMAPPLWDKYLILSTAERDLLVHFSRQPLTLLVKPHADLSHLAKAGLVALRLCDHPLMTALANAVDIPLTASSANVSGQPACFDLPCLSRAFPGQITPSVYDLSLACIIDAGSLPGRPPTTIASLVNGQINVIRPGSISGATLTAFLNHSSQS